MAGGFEISVLDSAGVQQGAGPITTAEQWTSTERLNRAGEVALRGAPMNDDTVQALVSVDRPQVVCTGIRANLPYVFGAGYIKQVEQQVDDQTPTTRLNAAGPNMLEELTWRKLPKLSLDNGSGGPTATGLATLMTYAPAGWVLDTVLGYGTTLATVYLQFNGETLLDALNKLAEKTGESWYGTADRRIVWRRLDQPASGVRAVAGIDARDVANAPEICLIQHLARTKKTETFSRVYPTGGGNGDAALSLRASTRFGAAGNTNGDYTSGGYTLHIETDPTQCCIIYAAGDAVRRIDQPRTYNDLSQAATGATHGTSAANQLFDVALLDLQDHVAAQSTYTLSVTSLQQDLFPGQTIHVEYEEYADAVATWSINQDLVILEIRTTVDTAGETVSVDLTVATIARWPSSDARSGVGAARAGQAAQSHRQKAEDSIHADTADTATNLPTSATPTLLGLIISGIAGTLRDLIYQTAGSNRWALRADGTAEGGANAGTDFRVVSYADDGTTATTRGIWKRSTGFFGIGIGSNTPSSLLTLGGAMAIPFATKAGAYTLTATDAGIDVDASGGPRTATLPTCVGCPGRIYVITRINSGANNVTVACNGAETINGAATYVLTTQYQSVTLYSTNTEWRIIGKA